MALAFRISVSGVHHAASFLEGMAENARNPRAALEEIYLTFLDIVGETFDASGARGGFPVWKSLQLDTVVRKVKLGLDPRILRATGAMHEALTSYRSPEVSVRIDRYGITFNPRMLRARVAQTGGGRVPARPWVRLTESDRKAFSREIARHLVKRRVM